jgi:hypothetical protein
VATHDEDVHCGRPSPDCLVKGGHDTADDIRQDAAIPAVWGRQHPWRGWGACRMVIEVAAAEPVLGTATPFSRNLGEATNMISLTSGFHSRLGPTIEGASRCESN